MHSLHPAPALVALALLLGAGGAAACPAADDCFRDGVRLYGAERFQEAAAALEQAVAMAPGVSTYHHWLGKSYGRRAERVNWLRALPLARRTLREFETAVKLDENNIDALRDLASYYRLAPGFLGGSREKAEAAEARLDAIIAGGGAPPPEVPL